MSILRTLWTAVRALWTTLAFAFAGTAVLVGGSIALVLGAVAGGVAAFFGAGLLSLATNSTHSDARFINIVTLLGTIVGAAIALVRFYRRYLANPSNAGVHGSARFDNSREVQAARNAGTGRLIIGRELKPNGKPGALLHDHGPAHLLTLAPTRSGKGVGAVIPNLLTVKRSVLCIDPKGDNTRVTEAARRRFGPVHVLDPFGITGRPAAAYNPLDRLDPESPDLAEDAATIADALVHDPPGHAGEAHWNEEAKALLTGLILFVVTQEPPQRRTLAAVRELVTLAPQAFADLLERMQASTAANGLVARAANRHCGKSDREAAGVLSSAQRHTHFLDSPRMAAVTARSDFRFADLKQHTATVFLVLPPDRLDAYSRWLRLLVAQAVTDMARSPVQPPSPVLFLLDEFAALGPLEPVVRAYGLMAGYGMQLWAILQDLHQLKSLYGPRAGTFLSNAGVTQVFNVNDVETATWISKTLGATTEAYETPSQGVTYGKDAPFLGTRSQGSATHLARRDLLTPDEVMRLPAGTMLLFRQGAYPIRAGKVRYFADPEFHGLFDRPDASAISPARPAPVAAE